RVRGERRRSNRVLRRADSERREGARRRSGARVHEPLRPARREERRGLELPMTELEAALESLEPKRRASLEAAAARVRGYHEKQKIECGSHSWQYTEADGTVLGQKVTPLD